MKDAGPDIKYLFEPRAVAVIGASHNKEKIGYKVLENIIAGGYGGKIYPVNPQGGEILGVPVYKTINEITDQIDLACITIPAEFVFDAVKNCADKGVKFAAIITSGFSEIGNIADEKKIVAYANEHGMRVLGPNIFGIFSAASSLNATFGPNDIKIGSVAILTQSGALGVSMIGKTAVENIGLSTIISVGNKADITEADLLGYLTEHENTKVIMMYLEGVKDGEKLVNALKITTWKKPVVVIKSGRSKRGSMAAASHTGSLAGSDEIFGDVMKQCDVVRAESIKDALDLCKFFENTPVPAGENAVIITNGGGIGVMATDACEKYGVKLYDDYNALKNSFSNIMPYFGSAKNPIDLTGQAAPADYNSAFNAALNNNNIDAVISLYCETAVFDTAKFSPLLEENYKKYKTAKKPIVFCLVGGKRAEDCVETLRKRDVPVFTDPYEAVSCMGAMYSYYRYLKDKSYEIDEADMNIDSIENIVKAAREDKRTSLFSRECQGVMNAADIPIPKSYTARNLVEAVDYSEKIGYPVVLKIVSKDVLHKSDVGGVVLDLENKKEVIDAYEAIIYNCRAHRPNAVIEGVEVSEMVKHGIEIIVGARRDLSFGPIVMFGLGGTYVEVLKDVAFRALPINRKEAISMIKEIKSYPLLLGVRGEERKDIESIVEAIIKLGTVITKCKNITDIEINPLMVYEQGKGVKAVDARIMISNT